MAVCSNCGQEAGEDNFCGACGIKISGSTFAAPEVSNQLAPPTEPSRLPPAPRSTKGLETAGKAAAGCGVVALIVIAIGLIMLIQFFRAISSPTGMGAHVIAASLVFPYRRATTLRK